MDQFYISIILDFGLIKHNKGFLEIFFQTPPNQSSENKVLRTKFWVSFSELWFSEVPRNSSKKPLLWGVFLGTWPQSSKTNLSRLPSPNLAQNFGQIPSRALGLTIFSELHLKVVAPRFEEIQGRQTERQQTLAFRYRSRSLTELVYRGECPTCRPLPVLSLGLSIWNGSAFRDVAASKPAYRCQVHTHQLIAVYDPT